MGEEKLRQNQEGKLLCKYFLLISSQLFSPFLLICRENCRLNFSSFMSCWEQFSLEADVYLWNQYNTTAANWRVKAWGWKVNIYPIHFTADLFPYSPNALRWLPCTVCYPRAPALLSFMWKKFLSYAARPKCSKWGPAGRSVQKLIPTKMLIQENLCHKHHLQRGHWNSLGDSKYLIQTLRQFQVQKAGKKFV